MMEKKTQEKPSKKKFKQTKQLIKLALNDDWTQISIAKACRTQQSVISAWLHGEKQGTESQLKPLLEQYGNQLRRKSFQLYYRFDSDKKKFKYLKVEGKIIFSYTYIKEKEINSKRVKKIPFIKIIVQEQGKGIFRIIEQSRPCFDEYKNIFLECPQESGYWFSHVGEQIDIKKMIQKLEEISKKWRNEQYSIPFLIRKALLENGYHLDDVEEYPLM